MVVNPCPCGYYNDPEKQCECSYQEIKRYKRKISGPLLDRIDIQIRVPRVTYTELTSTQQSEASAVIRKRVSATQDRQLARLEKYGIVCNAQMSSSILKNCRITKEAQQLLRDAFIEKSMSARSYDRIKKVAQTIADLDNSDIITEVHLAEAIQLRNDIGV